MVNRTVGQSGRTPSGLRAVGDIDPNMATRRGKGESEPLTLGQALAAQVRIIAWYKSCNHRAEPDIATQVAQHGAGMPVIDWARVWGAGRVAPSALGEPTKKGAAP